MVLINLATKQKTATSDQQKARIKNYRDLLLKNWQTSKCAVFDYFQSSQELLGEELEMARLMVDAAQTLISHGHTGKRGSVLSFILFEYELLKDGLVIKRGKVRQLGKNKLPRNYIRRFYSVVEGRVIIPEELQALFNSRAS